jgi:hypothetical protein
MKLKKEIVSFIKEAVTTAKDLKFDDMCIEQGLIRAMPEDQSVFFVHNHNTELPFDTLGITRIPELLNRLNIITESDEYTIEFKEIDGEVRSLSMKNNETKIDFKCSNPAKIRAPRKINDPMMFGIHISTESIDMLKRSHAAMKTDLVTFIADDDGVRFEMNDINNDVFTHKVAENVVCVEEIQDAHFSFRYPTVLLLSLLNKEIKYFEVGKSGTMLINTISGFNIYIPPRV